MNKIYHRVKLLFKNEKIIYSLIILIAIILRLYRFSSPIADWHSWRQADTSSVSKIYVEEGINLLYPRYYDISTTQTRLFNPEGLRFVEFPLYNALTAFFKISLGYFSVEQWGRIVSIVASIITLSFIYLIARKYLGRWGAYLASILYAIIPFNIYYSRVILPEPLATAFVISSIWFFILYIEKESSKHLYISSILFALALLVKPFAVFYGIAMIYLALDKFGLEKALKKKELYIFSIISIAPFLVWRAWISQFPEGIPLWKWAFNGDGIRFRPAFWRWIFAERLGNLILGFWGLVPFSIGLLSLSKKNKFIHILLFSMFAYVTVVASANVKHDYYQIITIPAIVLGLALGIKSLWDTNYYNKILSRGLLIFCLFMMFNVTFYKVKDFYQINRPEIIEAGKKIDSLVPKESLVIAPYNGDTAFLYQTNRWGWPVVDRPIDELIDKGADYFVSVDLNHPQTIEFEERFKLVEKTDSYIILKLSE